MAQLFSEINKINCALKPGLQSSGTAAAETLYHTDILKMKNYKLCTFIVQVGATVAKNVWNIVPCGGTSGGATTKLTGYYYRTQGTTTAAYAAGSDTPGALTAGTTAGFNTTTGYDGGIAIVEVPASIVHNAGATFDCVKLQFSATTEASNPRAKAVLAILSEPRYPQGVLNSAI